MLQRRVMRWQEVTHLTGYGKTAIQRFIKEGSFPPPRPLGPRAVGFDSIAVQSWIDSKLEVRQ